MLIKNQTQLFSYIDRDFENWKVDEGVQKTGVKLKTITQTKDFKFSDVFKPEDAIFQEDVIKFVQENHIHNSHFFLIKNSKGNLFVVDVNRNGWPSGPLRAHVHEFTDDDIWFSENEYRIVVPAKTSNTSETLSTSDTLTLKQAVSICKQNGLKVTREKLVIEEL